MQDRRRDSDTPRKRTASGGDKRTTQTRSENLDKRWKRLYGARSDLRQIPDPPEPDRNFEPRVTSSPRPSQAGKGGEEANSEEKEHKTSRVSPLLLPRVLRSAVKNCASHGGGGVAPGTETLFQTAVTTFYVGGAETREAVKRRDSRHMTPPPPRGDRDTAARSCTQEAMRPQSRCVTRRRMAAPRGHQQPPSALGLPGVMDAEGRVDESRLRGYIFKHGGVSPSERGQVWRFLFGVFPCSSTALERPLLQEQLAVRYQVMKKKWQRLLPAAERMRLNGTDAELVVAVRLFEQRKEKCGREQREPREEDRERLSFLELQAQVLLERVTFDLDELQEAVRIIDKDVPRTNRDLDYYLGEGSGNLLVLRDILITFAAFHPGASSRPPAYTLKPRFTFLSLFFIDFNYTCVSSASSSKALLQ
ncbi:TBC1 domain family member 15-like [Arapaima gigas]